MKLQLAAGRVPSRRGKPESDGGYKIYLTTQDRDQWVEFGGGGRRKIPNGLLPQKQNGVESADAAWRWVEENLLDNRELVERPGDFHELWPYNASAPRMAEILWDTARPMDYRGVASEPPSRVALFDITRDVAKYERPKRPNQKAFRQAVIARYGAKCAFCRVSWDELIDAAHIIAWKDQGADVPENGLVLCKLHHHALDARLVGIEPATLRLHFADGIGPQGLMVEVSELAHLPSAPQEEALQWLWNLFGKL